MATRLKRVLARPDVGIAFYKRAGVMDV